MVFPIFFTEKQLMAFSCKKYHGQQVSPLCGNREWIFLSELDTTCQPRFDNTDSNFFYDYLALLGTMQLLGLCD